MPEFYQLTKWRNPDALIRKNKTTLEYYREVLAEELKGCREAQIHERAHDGWKQIAVFVELPDELSRDMAELEEMEVNVYDIRNPL
jgi:hypothetical protein